MEKNHPQMWMVFLDLYPCKKTTIFGIGTIIEAVKSKEDIDWIFLQTKLKGELYRELEQLINNARFNAP